VKGVPTESEGWRIKTKEGRELLERGNREGKAVK